MTRRRRAPETRCADCTWERPFEPEYNGQRWICPGCGMLWTASPLHTWWQYKEFLRAGGFEPDQLGWKGSHAWDSTARVTAMT